MNAIPRVVLNNGIEMPLLGFGVFQIPPTETERAVAEALEAGYRSIDTAAAYQNEEGVGRAIARSGIPRDELFITTKLWIQDAGESRAARAFETSLTRLGVERLDLCLIHQPFGDYYGSWRVLEDRYRAGRVRAIGVSNFYPDRLVDLMAHNSVIPAINQLEVHPYFQRRDDQSLLTERGVQLQAWGPLAQGNHDLLLDPTLTTIAQAHGRSSAQVALRWLLQRNIVTVVKSSSSARMRENLGAVDFSLSDAEMEQITTLDGRTGPAFDHRDPTGVDFIHSLDLT